MRNDYHRELKAIIKLLAALVSQDGAPIDEVIEWAYGEDGAESDTEKIIREFLSTEGHVSASIKNDFICRFIESKEPFPVEAAKAIILHMPYEDFLKTPYWKAIAKYVKGRDYNRCVKCGNKKGLHVHHKTYQHHGDELHHLDDLTCVCRQCHREIHENRLREDFPFH